MSSVVDFPKGLTLEPKKKDWRCGCRALEICETTRMLECKNCGAKIEPFDYLWKMANRQYNHHMNNRVQAQESKRLSAEIEDLKRQKRNLQGQVNRLRRKT